MAILNTKYAINIIRELLQQNFGDQMTGNICMSKMQMALGMV